MHGLDLNAFGIFLYFAILFLWSMFVAYVLVFGVTSKGGESHDTHGGGHAPEPSSHGHHAPAPVEETRAKPFRGFSPYEGFKSYAQGETVTVEDIVKGLARETEHSILSFAEDIAQQLPHVRHEEPPLVKPPVTGIAPESSPLVGEFIEAVARGDRDTAFAMLRDIEDHGEGSEAFLKKVVALIEGALESRKSGVPADRKVREALLPYETPTVEELAKALATAEGKTGSKLALTRAFSALKK
jgi:hypothetical protein